MTQVRQLLPEPTARRLYRRGRRLAARGVKVLRRRGVITSPARPRDFAAFGLDGDAAWVRFRRLGRGGSPLALRLVARRAGTEVTVPLGAADAEGVRLGRIDLVWLLQAQAEVADSWDLYLDWQEVVAGTGAGEPPRVTLRRFGRMPTMLRSEERLVTTLDIDERQVEVLFETTARGNLTLYVDTWPDPAVTRTSVTFQATADATTVVIDLDTGNRPVRAARIGAVGRQTRTETGYDLPFAFLPDTAADRWGRLQYRVQARIDFTRIAAAMPASEETVDVGVYLDLEGEATPVRVPVDLPKKMSEGQLDVTAVAIGDQTTVFVPYLTFRGHHLTYRVEHWDTDTHRYLQRMLRLRWALPVLRAVSGIWLVGEVPYKAQDNGYHFFAHLRRRHPRRRAYYVIDKTSPDYAKVAALGNVVDRFSREHVRTSLLASRLVSSHHSEYLHCSRDRRVAAATQGIRIFLQHGVTATKNVTLNYGRQGTWERPTDKFCVTSTIERQIVVEDYGYRPRQVPVTGFARWDALLADRPDPEPIIMIMPTWRDSVTGEASFLASDFYRHWHGLLADPRLQQLLREHEMTVDFVLHPNMRMYAEFFDLPQVRLLRQDQVDVQQLLRRSALLVTDFSSVAWDFAFLHRPVLYFQFDQAQLNRSATRKPHIDMVTDLPGPTVATIDSLLTELGQALGRGAVMAPGYQARADRFIAHRDTRNCERIFDVVRAANGAGVLFERLRNARRVQRTWKKFRSGRRYRTWMVRVFNVARLLPRRDTVVFECDRGTHYGDAPRYLYERLSERDHGLRVVWANNTTVRLSGPSTTKIKRFGPRYFWELGRARYWINNQNFPADLAKPRGTKFLQTWHGTPLKRMQHDVAVMASRDADYEKRADRLVSYWDQLVSASPYASTCFRSAFRFGGEVLELGYPRNDPFSWSDADARTRAVRARLGLLDDPRRIMLYAPTFRDDNRQGANWRHEVALDVERLAHEFAHDWVLVVRFHPLVRQALKPTAETAGFVIDASGYDDIQELLLGADVLITDYSSMFFDYAQLDRPILFFTYDLENYRDVLRGFYLDFEAEAPGPLLGTNEALVDAVHRLPEIDAAYADRRRDFAARFGPRDDGGAADRVLDAFLGAAAGTPRVSA